MRKFLFFCWMTLLLSNLNASEIVLFSGNANKDLAQKVADYLHLPLGDLTVGKFNDGEIQIKINENIRGKDIFIIQPSCSNEFRSINDHLMELYLLVRTMKRASVHSITAVIPYYGYARQDRKMGPKDPISASDVAMLLETAGMDRVITVDLHCGQIQGFFHDVPLDNLFASPLFVPYIVGKNFKNLVIVSPDAGGVERANKLIEALKKRDVNAKLAIISKERAKAGVVASMNLIGEVKGSDTIIVDDLCDTAGTLVKAAQLLKDQGSSRVIAITTHPVFSLSALDKIRDSVLEEMVITDTIPLRGKVPSKIHTISVAPLIGEAILRSQEQKPLTMLLEEGA